MIYQKRDKWCFRDESGKLHKFNTQEEAAKAKGLVVEKDYAEKEEDNHEEAPKHYKWLENKEVDTEE